MNNSKTLIERANEIVPYLRNTCNGCNPTPCCEYEVLGSAAANVIGELVADYNRLNDFDKTQSYKLLAQLSAVTAERDEALRRERSAVEWLDGHCFSCAHINDCAKHDNNDTAPTVWL